MGALYRSREERNPSTVCGEKKEDVPAVKEGAAERSATRFEPGGT